MKSKQQTPLGYLMGLLDVSLAELGEYLYVAQTTISKWRTGARALKPGSQHFAGIVEYFAMLTRDPARRERLVALFENLYPGQPLDSPADVAACVRAFLGGGMLPTASQRRAIGPEGRLYTAQVGVYSGAQGLQAAYEQLRALLDESGPSQLAVADRQGLYVLQRLMPQLSEGHTLRILADPPPAQALLSEQARVLALAGTEIRLMPPNAPFAPGSVSALAEGELMLQGHARPGHAPYAALYTDPLTLEQHQAIFDEVWAGAPALFETVEAERLGPELFAAARDAFVSECTEWITPGLPYLTMSGELLMEVLRAGGVHGRVWTRVLAGSRVLERAPMRLFVPVEALRAPHGLLPELSMLCGREIRLTRAQARRHMLDTAALLRAGEGLSLVPLQAEDAARAQLPLFVRRNAFAGLLDYGGGLVRVTHKAGLVESFMQAADLLASRATSQLQSPAHVAGLLEQAALEASQDGETPSQSETEGNEGYAF